MTRDTHAEVLALIHAADRLTAYVEGLYAESEMPEHVAGMVADIAAAIAPFMGEPA